MWSFLSLTGILVVRDQTQDVSGLTVDVEAHGQFTERELHHKVGVTVRWGRLKDQREKTQWLEPGI